MAEEKNINAELPQKRTYKNIFIITVIALSCIIISTFVIKFLYTQNLYQRDKMVYEELQCNLNSNDEKDWIKVQDNINSLRTDMYRGRITNSMLSNIEERVHVRVLYNTLKFLEELVMENYNLVSESGVTNSYYYSMPKGMQKEFILSIPQGFDLGNVPIEGFGGILPYNLSYNDAVLCYSKTTKEVKAQPVQEAINEGKSGGFIVEYVGSTLDDEIYWLNTSFYIDAEYEDGIFELYLKTVDANGESHSEVIDVKNLAFLKAVSTQYSGVSQYSNNSSHLTQEQIIDMTKRNLGVPNNINTTYRIDGLYYWEAGQTYYYNITFYENGKTVAGANVDSKTGELLNNILDYSTPGNLDFDIKVNAFYGVWCSGSKTESDAKKFALELSNKGFEAQVIVTTDWENLNPEKFYVVTAGVCKTKQEAEQLLISVKREGYSDAYVKYTGKRK